MAESPFPHPKWNVVGIASCFLCASGATINNSSNQHLHFSALLKAEVNLNSLYQESSWVFFLPHSVAGSLTFQSSGLSGRILRGKTVSCGCCALGSVAIDFV